MSVLQASSRSRISTIVSIYSLFSSNSIRVGLFRDFNVVRGGNHTVVFFYFCHAPRGIRKQEAGRTYRRGVCQVIVGALQHSRLLSRAVLRSRSLDPGDRNLYLIIHCVGGNNIRLFVWFRGLRARLDARLYVRIKGKLVRRGNFQLPGGYASGNGSLFLATKGDHQPPIGGLISLRSLYRLVSLSISLVLQGLASLRNMYRVSVGYRIQVWNVILRRRKRSPLLQFRVVKGLAISPRLAIYSLLRTYSSARDNKFSASKQACGSRGLFVVCVGVGVLRAMVLQVGLLACVSGYGF